MKKQGVRVSVPTEDRERARAFYKDILALKLIQEHEFAVIFESNGTQISLVESEDAGKASYSLITLMVEDIDARMSALRDAGVQFEDYDFGPIKTINGKAQFNDDYVAWFKDCEGNLLALAQLQS